MKKIIRRLTAFALCAILVMAMPLASAQELFTPEGVLLTVQIAVTLPNGTLSFLPVTPVTSTMGDTVYWVDESTLSDDEIALLATAQLQLTSETGELYAELPLSDVGFAGAIDERLDVVSDMIPGGSLTILPAESAAPMDGEEADAVLSQYGFETPAPVEPEPDGRARTHSRSSTEQPEQDPSRTRAAGAARAAGTAPSSRNSAEQPEQPRAAGAAARAAERAGNSGVCDRGGRRRDVVQQRQHVGRGGYPERRRCADGHGLHDG